MASLISKASLLMVPSTYEDGTLYNVLPSGNKAPDETGNNNGYDQTRADFTFSRGSNLAATRVNASGLIKKGRENLLLQSNAFDTTWTLTGSTLASGQADKDGGTSAWKLTSSNTGQSFVKQVVSSSGVATYSVYAKAGASNFIVVYAVGGGDPRTFFDLENGTTETAAHNITNKIEDVGNGWFRCSVIFNKTISDVRLFIADSDNVFNSGNGSSIYIQSAQLEKGLVSTPYIETGATTAQAGILEDMPRINYDANGENGALLLEPSRSNLITNSEYFGAWTASGLTISSNEATSPEGVSNAAKLTLPSGSAIKRIALGSMPVTAVARSYSFFVKSDDINAIQLVHSGDVQGYARFDISSGVVGSKGSKTTSDIEYYGNGWYRCIADFDATNSFGSTIYLYINDSATGGYGGSTSAQGDLFIYGAQYEEGSHVSSYVPTYGSAVTRSADSCSVTGVSDVIGQTEGTLYFECTNKALQSNARYFSLSDGTGNNRIDIYHHSSDRIGIYVATAGAAQVNVTDVDLPASGVFKFALGYKLNDYVWYVNGSQIGTDTSASVPSQSDVLIAANSDSTTNPGGNGFKECVLFNERLTNTELATLTTL